MNTTLVRMKFGLTLPNSTISLGEAVDSCVITMDSEGMPSSVIAQITRLTDILAVECSIGTQELQQLHGEIEAAVIKTLFMEYLRKEVKVVLMP